MKYRVLKINGRNEKIGSVGEVPKLSIDPTPQIIIQFIDGREVFHPWQVEPVSENTPITPLRTSARGGKWAAQKCRRCRRFHQGEPPYCSRCSKVKARRMQKGISLPDPTELAKLHRAGRSIKAIAKQFDCPPSMINHELTQYGDKHHAHAQSND